MYKESIALLSEKDVKFEEGLTPDELMQVERIYDLIFPKSLREFLMTALPVSKGFYNWRNKEENNVKDIMSMIKQPTRYINDMPEEVYWCDDWGKEPEDKEVLIKEVKERVGRAPKLIPVFNHRYMPMVFDENPPVISVHGVDVIYMGYDLEDYFMVEYGKKKQSDINFSSIESIPFWADLM